MRGGVLHNSRRQLRRGLAKRLFRLVASANFPTVVELIVESIGELLNCYNLEFLKPCFKIIHYKNTLNNLFN